MSDHELAIFPAPHSGGDSTDQTSQPNLRNLNFTNTLYPLAFYQVLLQHLNAKYPLYFGRKNRNVVGFHYKNKPAQRVPSS
jgi:hypothetical protein